MRFQYDYSHKKIDGTVTDRSRCAVTSLCIVLLIFGCVTFLTGASGESERDSDVASKVRSLEGLKFEAQKERNLAALDALFDDGLMWVDANGNLSTKAGYMERIHQSASSQLRIESMTVRVFDQMAIVVGIYDEGGIRNNRPSRQRCRFIDTWTLKRDKWVLIAATATSTIT